MIADLLRRWKQTRRIAAAEAEILSRPLNAGAAHGLGTQLIVSLTSYPARFASLHLVLRSLLSQTVRPDQVVLWLDEGDEATLPAAVTDLAGVEIKICPNWRSYKKIVPSLRDNPGAHLVTADDDIYYARDWLEMLVRHADAGVVCHRAHRITLNGAGLPKSYEDWQRNLDAPDCSSLIFPTGVGGVLYAPGVFHPDICDPDIFMQLAPAADDVWLYWMHRLAGSQPRKIGGRFRITEWPGTQAQNLRSSNLAGGSLGAGESGNDRAIRAMLERYGFPGA